MKISHVELAGFRGFKSRARFDFPLGFSVITGRNGVGKSTAFDAIDFALTGSIGKFEVREAKGGGLEEHLWWAGDGPASEHYVTVGFIADDGRILEVTRGRDGSIVSGDLESLASHLCVGGAGMPKWAQTIMRTSLIRDENISAWSVDLTEQARFAAVRSALGVSEAPDHNTRLKEIVKVAESVRDQQRARHAKAHDDLGRALTGVTEARSLAERDKDLAAANSIIEAQLEGVLGGEGDRMSSVRSLLIERRRVLGEISSLIAEDMRLRNNEQECEAAEFIEALESLQQRKSQLELKLEAVREARRVAEEALSQAEALDSQAAHHLTLLDLGGAVGLQDGRCPLCSTPRAEEDFLAAIATARAILRERTPQASRAAAEINAATVQAAEAACQFSEVVENLRRLETLREKVRSDRAQLAEKFANFGIGKVADADELMLKQQEQMALLEQAVLMLESSGAQDRVIGLSRRADNLRGVVEEEALRLDDAERALDRAQQIEKASKIVANELLSEQLDTVLPLLKELYQRLRPHPDWREIEIDVAGQVRGSLNFAVGEGKNPQFLFSSGQRRATGLAFLLAIHLARRWCRLDTLMLDDPIQHIDDYRALNLVEVLSSIRRSGRQVIIAVEDDALADALCRRLRSSPNEGGKRFELGLDTEGSASISREFAIPTLARAVLEIA